MEEEAFLTLQQVEADLHRETAFVWILRWLDKVDGDLKSQILHGNSMEQPVEIVKWQAKRELIESLFGEIENIRNLENGNQGIQ
jgi:hypothetical protein